MCVNSKQLKKITERNTSPTAYPTCVHSHADGHCFVHGQAEQISPRLVLTYILCLAQLYKCTIQLKASLCTRVLHRTKANQRFSVI